jgi:glycine/D-amino acid oxidase-like deaminating enzyme
MLLGETLFHETGLLVLCKSTLDEDSFEGNSFALLSERDYPLRRLRGAEISHRIPAIRDGAYADAYVNERGGWAQSGKLVTRLAQEAVAQGVVIREGVSVLPFDAPSKGESTTSVTTQAGEKIPFGTLIIAAGAFTPVLLPELADRMTSVGQSVFHFAPKDPALFTVPTFLPWAADIAQIGPDGQDPEQRRQEVLEFGGPGDRFNAQRVQREQARGERGRCEQTDGKECRGRATHFNVERSRHRRVFMSMRPKRRARL